MGTEDLKEVFKLDLVYGKDHSTHGGRVTLNAYAWYIEDGKIKSQHIYGCRGGTDSSRFAFEEPEYETDKPYIIGYTLYGTPEQVAAIITTHYAVDINHERIRY